MCMKHRTFCHQTWYGEPVSYTRKLFAIFKVAVTERAHMIKICLSTIPSELLIIQQPDLV